MRGIEIIGRVPLSTTMIVTPTITFAQRVCPFEVARFVARGIGVTIPYWEYNGGACRFVGYGATRSCKIAITLIRAHVRVYVTGTRRCNFVTSGYLIIQFTVTSCLFFYAT